MENNKSSDEVWPPYAFTAEQVHQAYENGKADKEKQMNRNIQVLLSAAKIFVEYYGIRESNSLESHQFLRAMEAFHIFKDPTDGK